MTARESFTASLYAPFIDLSAPSAQAPIHVQKPLSLAVEHFERRMQIWTLQRAIPSTFRPALARQIRASTLPVTAPTVVAGLSDSERWQQLVEDVARYSALDEPRQASLVRLLFSLGFHATCVALTSNGVASDHESLEARSRSQERSHIQLVHANALWVQWIDDPSTAYSPALHAEVHQNASPATLLRFVAALHLLVFHARNTRDTQLIAHWDRVCLEELYAIEGADYADFYKNLMWSRYYRAQAFIPYLRNDQREALKSMRRAEEFARAMKPSSIHEQLLQRENIFPLSETHGKTALWAGDVELAEAMYTRLVENDPYDPKAHIEYAEFMCAIGKADVALRHYLRASLYAPPGGALGLYMAGQLAALKEGEHGASKGLAMSLHLSALSQDNEACAALEELCEVSAQCSGEEFISAWARAQLEVTPSPTPTLAQEAA